MSAKKVRRPPRRARSSGAATSPQHTEDSLIILPTTLEVQKQEEPGWEHFASRRSQREQVLQHFIDKAKRTPLRARRWFRIADIAADEAKRAELRKHLRASIWHGDLMLRDKSQVLCLSASPLMENNRLPPGYARDEIFYSIVDDLWMSVPRWLQWFVQVGIEPPEWMSMREWLKWFHQQGKPLPKWLDSLQAAPQLNVPSPPPPAPPPRDPSSSATTSSRATRGTANYLLLPDNPPRRKTDAAAYKALLSMHPDRHIPGHLSVQQLANNASVESKRLGGPSIISREAVLRALNRKP